LVREAKVDWSKPWETTPFTPLEECEHGLLHKTHWREAKMESTPMRELAVIESPVAIERVPAEARTQEPGTVHAVPMQAPPPVYPPGSLRAREEGSVTLRVVIGSDGRTISVQVELSSGYRRLDQAALEALRCWRFRPARRGGVPIESILLHIFTFQLQIQ
jgi:protein TonB